MDTGQEFENFNSSCFNENLHNLINDIEARHKVTEYKRIFERNLKERNWYLRFKGPQLHYTLPKKCLNQVHPSHIREGMRRISHKLIPLQIIGNNGNHAKVFKALYNFLNTGKTEPFSLLNLVKNLNFESITWVQAINDPIHKCIFLGKFIKWLFQLFIAIIEKVFYVTHIQGEKVFIFLADWEAQKNHQLKTNCQRSALQLVGSVGKSSETNNRICFMPRLGNLRPITIFKYSSDEIQLLRQTKAVLEYLYNNNYPKPDPPFKERLIEIFRDYNRDNNRIFLVSCDIADAYSSIVQGKLFDIVRKMFKTVPDEVKFTYTFVRNVKRYQIITDTNKLPCDSQKIESVDKQVLLQVLKNHIFQTQVIFKKNIYNINRGITQGSIVSSLLCALYYAQMNEKYFSKFKAKGDLFNYVDDFLFVTKQLVFAQNFLEQVKKGIPEFNCHFKKKKLQHNLTSQNSSSVTYLGWKFNLHPLKIEPKFNSIRHSIYFNSSNIGSHEFKLRHFSSLKLDKLMFTKKIHNDEQVFENVELVCQRQAERCFALSICWYATRREIVDIKSIIKVNGMLISKIQRLIEWDIREQKKNKNILEIIMWQSFLHVFARRHDIFFDLIDRFKSLMKHKKRILKIKN